MFQQVMAYVSWLILPLHIIILFIFDPAFSSDNDNTMQLSHEALKNLFIENSHFIVLSLIIGPCGYLD